MAELQRRALQEPEFDLFEHTKPRDPKRVIGQYVASHGVSVPLIDSQEEFTSQLDTGRIILRSELRQDYSGFSGILDSVCIPDYDGDLLVRHSQIVNILDKETLATLKSGVMQSLRERDGLYIAEDYLRGLVWGEDIRTILLSLLELDDKRDERDKRIQDLIDSLGYLELASSPWRHIPGYNVTIMRDPSVASEYHVGLTGARSSYSRRVNLNMMDDQLVGRVFLDPSEEYERYVASLPTARGAVEMYEKVRALPYFDQRQVPVMEMQYGDDGKWYFLQYLKTGLELNEVEEFELKEGDQTLRINLVRGATSKEGECVRLYLGRGREDPFRSEMMGQGIFDHDRMMHHGEGHGLGRHDIGGQLAMMATKLYVGYLYPMSMSGGHSNRLGLTRPRYAASLYPNSREDADNPTLCNLVRLGKDSEREYQQGKLPYINVVYTSNGRRGTIESDWIVRY